MREVATRFLGLLSYEEAWRLQMEVLAQRAESAVPDTLLVVEHPPVITLGRRSPGVREQSESLPVEIQGVPVHVVERGGEATFHGPGQLVLYPILQLNVHFGPKALLRLLEEAMVAVLLRYRLSAYWIEGKTGVWLQDSASSEKKIASLGIAVRRGVSYHGLALNVNTDLSFFRLIEPCGFAPSVMTSMQALLGRGVDLEEVAVHLDRELRRRLDAVRVQRCG